VEVRDFLSQLPQHKELQAAQAAWVAARLQVTAVEREANPVVSASISYGNRFSQRRDQPSNPPFDNREWTVGLQYSVPLFSGFSGHYKLREAQSQADYQLSQSDVVRERLQSTGLQNQQALRLEQMQLESWVRVVDLSLFNMSATRERYLRGVSDINFVLNAEREAAAALTEQSRAKTRFQVAKWKHLRDMGEIRDSIR
jgi:outer membrane protein